MINIIWADDQIDIVKSLSHLLQPLKPNITAVETGILALEQLKNNIFDILVLDLMMPPGQWGGLWLLREMKELGINTPVIVVSGEGTQTETIKALRLGAKDYVMKEVIETELVERINTIVNDFNATYSTEILLKKGESEAVEFKSTLRFNIKTKKNDKDIQHSVLKTISAFLNSDGGNLFIGVDDSGNPIGLKSDGFINKDKIMQHLTNLIKNHIGINHCSNIKMTFDIINDRDVFRIYCSKAFNPCYLRHNNNEYFYVRIGPTSTLLPVSEIHNYIKRRF